MLLAALKRSPATAPLAAARAQELVGGLIAADYRTQASVAHLSPLINPSPANLSVVPTSPEEVIQQPWSLACAAWVACDGLLPSHVSGAGLHAIACLAMACQAKSCDGCAFSCKKLRSEGASPAPWGQTAQLHDAVVRAATAEAEAARLREQLRDTQHAARAAQEQRQAEALHRQQAESRVRTAKAGCLHAKE